MAFKCTPAVDPATDTYTVDQIVTAMEDTYQACAHDVPGEWAASSVLDFLVSGNGLYADGWNNRIYFDTDPSVSAAALKTFAARYGVSE